jgi:hypothetical protein
MWIDPQIDTKIVTKYSEVSYSSFCDFGLRYLWGGFASFLLSFESKLAAKAEHSRRGVYLEGLSELLHYRMRADYRSNLMVTDFATHKARTFCLLRKY